MWMNKELEKKILEAAENITFEELDALIEKSNKQLGIIPDIINRKEEKWSNNND